MTEAETETLKPCPIGCTGISPQHMYREICRDMQSPNWNKPVSRIWCPCCGITMVKEGIEEVQAAWNIRKPGVAQCLDLEPTEAMLNAARNWSIKKYGMGIGNDAAIGCWKAMFLAASPDTSTDRTSK